MSSEKTETDEEFDARYVAFFSRPDIDGWEIRKVPPFFLLKLYQFNLDQFMSSNDQ